MHAKQSWGPVALISMLSLGLGAPPVAAWAGHAPGQGQSDHKAKAGKDHRDEDDSVVVRIDRDHYRRGVREYIALEALPPGLAKRRSLPPGLRKQLRERGRLPPGLEKHLTPAPASFDSRWPAVPAYYSRYFAGRDLLIVDTRTDSLIALIRDILP